MSVMKPSPSSFADFLMRRFPRNKVAPQHFSELLADYERSDLAPPHLIEEVTSGDDGKFWAHIWEAMLYRHFLSRRFSFVPNRVRKSGQIGPDFGLANGARTIWIEAVTPAPKGIPADWLEPPRVGEVRVRKMPHEEMLLRWTAVISDKRLKYDDYLAKGIIGAMDFAVIAVNSCRLSDFTIDDIGISQFPFAIEAVFPIGPLGVPLTREGKPQGKPTNLVREKLRKPSGVEVQTGNFLDPLYANVSAIIGCHRREMLDGTLPLTVVHNPLANNELPKQHLGASKEYIAEDAGAYYLLKQL